MSTVFFGARKGRATPFAGWKKGLVLGKSTEENPSTRGEAERLDSLECLARGQTAAGKTLPRLSTIDFAQPRNHFGAVFFGYNWSRTLLSWMRKSKPV